MKVKQGSHREQEHKPIIQKNEDLSEEEIKAIQKRCEENGENFSKLKYQVCISKSALRRVSLELE